MAMIHLTAIVGLKIMKDFHAEDSIFTLFSGDGCK
jgi:hypothetical protein